MQVLRTIRWSILFLWNLVAMLTANELQESIFYARITYLSYKFLLPECRYMKHWPSLASCFDRQARGVWDSVCQTKCGTRWLTGQGEISRLPPSPFKKKEERLNIVLVWFSRANSSADLHWFNRACWSGFSNQSCCFNYLFYKSRHYNSCILEPWMNYTDFLWKIKG